MTSFKAPKISKSFRPLVRHPEARDCPTCFWLNTHSDYESEYDCKDRDCPDCFILHSSIPVKYLKELKRSTSEYAALIDMNIDSGHDELGRDIELNPCVAKYALKYLSHVMRDGDCLSLYGKERERNDGIIIYYNKQFHLLSNDHDEYGSLPEFIDITSFGRADYFSWVIWHNTFVWTSFTGYHSLRVKRNRKLNYALWRISKNQDGPRLLLADKLIPALVDLVLDYSQDIWHVFSLFDDTVNMGHAEIYQYRYYYPDDRGNHLNKLLAPDNMTIPDKIKVLYSRDMSYN